MIKHIHTSSTSEAWARVSEIFPTDYTKDNESSAKAGYNVYRSDIEYYNYICDLGDRIEINLKDGNQTINIWIDDKSPESEPQNEQPAEMHENILTIGLFDKDTEKQEISTDAAKRIISDILIDKFDIFAFTMIDCSGVYKMVSTGRIVAEPSIRIEIATENDITETIINIITELKKVLNQESIMHKHQTAEINFR